MCKWRWNVYETLLVYNFYKLLISGHRCMTEELKKIVGENNALQSRLEAAEDEARRAVQRMEAAEKREQERDENYCDCLKRIQELERLLKEVRRGCFGQLMSCSTSTDKCGISRPAPCTRSPRVGCAGNAIVRTG